VTWVFAILLVLALGGIAMVAAGRGAPMAEEHDDRPDATVPATGPLSGAALRRVRFSIAVRGYRMSEVDALLDRLATEREQEHHRPRQPETPAPDPDQTAARSRDDVPPG
jgi:DivIVA domain-containing protein